MSGSFNCFGSVLLCSLREHSKTIYGGPRTLFFLCSSTSFPAAKTCLVLGFRETPVSAVEGHSVAQAWVSSFLDNNYLLGKSVSVV